MSILIEKTQLPFPGIEELHAEARGEGFDFIDTLVEEWANATNRYDHHGEALYGCIEAGRLVGVGGLNIDPFAGRADMGRIRRVYIRQAWRDQGLGRALMTALIDEARKSFTCVRLRAENADAARLYERLGFVPVEGPDATHVLSLKPPLRSAAEDI